MKPGGSKSRAPPLRSDGQLGAAAIESAAMRTALSTLWRSKHPRGPDELWERAAQMGAQAIVLDRTLPEDLRAALLATAPADLVAALEHTAAARLCAEDRAERQAAVAAAERALAGAGARGVPVVVLAPGGVALSIPDHEVALAFARGEWDPAAPQDERTARATRALDALRFALEPLCARAERESVRVALPTRGAPAELPTVDEAVGLLADFRGAPLGYWHDTAAAHQEAALGLEKEAAWLEQLGAAALGARASDACGLLAPLAPGVGEVDFASIARLPLAVLTAPPSAPAAEIAAALALLGAL